MNINSLDHFVLTVTDLQKSISFYTGIMGMELVKFGDKDHNYRYALRFGQQKINLHQKGNEYLPNAHSATPGSADLCFLSDTPLENIVHELNAANITVLQGPVKRTGATGEINSVYFRDPDENLIEVSNLLVADCDPDVAACP